MLSRSQTDQTLQPVRLNAMLDDAARAQSSIARDWRCRPPPPIFALAMSLLQRFARYDNPNSLGSRLRRKRSAAVRGLIEQCFAETGACRILDIGGEINYWNLYPREYLRRHQVQITLLNNSYEYGSARPDDPAIFSVMLGDACQLPFADRAFDIVHSNSTIEHVGDWKRKVAFARETRRVGRRYYVQMPSMSFPLEPHYGVPFFQFLPEPARIWLLQHFALGHYPRLPDLADAIRCHEDVRLISRRQFAYLFPDAELRYEKLFGLVKSLMAVRS
jgi:hypothetical protein